MKMAKVNIETLNRKDVEKMIEAAFVKRDERDAGLLAQRKVATIQKVETFNGETIPEQQVSDVRRLMNEDETIQNIKNIIAILPPNLIKDGRHSYPNIRALGGPHLTDELIDKVYDQLGLSEG